MIEWKVCAIRDFPLLLPCDLRLFEGLTPLVLPNSHGWTGHERGVGVIPGRDVQRGQRGDVAGDGVAKRERFKGFLRCPQRTGISASGWSPERQHPPNGPKAHRLKRIPNG